MNTDKNFAHLPPEVARRFEDVMTIDRLRGHVTRFVAEAKRAGDDDRWLPVAEIERIEGRSAVDVVADYLVRDRGIGVAVENLTPPQALHREADAQYVDPGARTRHERDLAREAVYHLLHNYTTFGVGELRRIVGAFYHAGDVGLGNALKRAVLSALDAVA